MSIVKEEFEGYVLEDDIKVEETSLQETYGDYSSVVIEQRLLICSLCKSFFERKDTQKLHQESDRYKCNRCILHSRLNEVFQRILLRKRKENHANKECVNITAPKTATEITESILVKKVMYLCATCKNPFEKKQTTGLREALDWYRCNKCILHSRIGKVLGPRKRPKQ